MPAPQQDSRVDTKIEEQKHPENQQCMEQPDEQQEPERQQCSDCSRYGLNGYAVLTDVEHVACHTLELTELESISN